MKQADVKKHTPYKLKWMCCRGRPELNGMIVEVIRMFPGTVKKPHLDYSGMIHGKGRGPAKYLLNIGIKVGAANLQEYR
jgi:hypothetical protein